MLFREITNVDNSEVLRNVVNVLCQANVWFLMLNVAVYILTTTL
jgi:hypothetical protein